MYPIIAKIGPFTLHSYGLLIAVGVFAGIQIAIRMAVRDGYEKKRVDESFYSLLFFAVIGGILGGRLFHVIIYWQDFADDLSAVFQIWKGGLVSYGGLLGAVIGFLIWHGKNSDYSWKKVADWFAPSLAFGHAIGRLGCFFAGCCYGIPTGKPWGIVFSYPDSLAPLGIHLHPTQLYESFFLVLLGFFLLWRFRHRTVDGTVFTEYLIFYSLGRFFLEFFRGGEPAVWGVTPGQLMSIFVLVLSGALKFRLLFRVNR